MTELLKKIKEALMSVLPVAVIVLILNLTPLVHFTGLEIGVFLVSAVFLILGIGLFSMGADLAMTPMGTHVSLHHFMMMRNQRIQRFIFL